MKAIAITVSTVFAIGSSAISYGATTDTCVASDPSKARDELRVASSGPELLNTTSFLPAGTSVDVILKEKYDSQTTYFALIESNFRGKTEGTSNILLHRNSINARLISADHPSVKAGEAQNTDTLISLVLPSIDSAWNKATLYVFKCQDANPLFASRLTMPISSYGYCILIVWSVLVLTYILAALAAGVVDKQNLRWIRYLDPVVLTAGSNGKGNLAKLQILFFSVIVFGLLGYIVLRTGVLSDISPTILGLLGIAAAGSAAAKATDVSRNRIDFENWAWFIRKRWLPPGGLAEVNDARWRDIVTTDGEFDVYHFQTLVFGLVVGGALLASGISDLATFSIPETLLGVLGLSQVVYIGGKLVAPPSCAELNTSTAALRDFERDFIVTATMTPDPQPPRGAQPLDPVRDLQAAIRRAGKTKYAAYLDKAKTVRIMFEAVTGRKVNAQDIEPSFSA